MEEPGRKILVVDDDRVFCAALASALRRRGHRCWVAHTVEEALEEATAWQPKFFCLDLRMGQESGLDLLRQVTEHFPESIVVVLTGYGSIASAVSAMKLGAIQYLTKPVSADDVLRAFDGHGPSSEPTETPPLDRVEWEHLHRVLTESGGNVSEAARRLNMHRRTLQRKLARRREP